MRVEILLPSEDLRRNLVLLRGCTGMVQRMIGQIAQQLAEGLGAMESMAAEKSFDLAEKLGLFPSRGPPRGHCNTKVTRFASLCEITA